MQVRRIGYVGMRMDDVDAMTVALPVWAAEAFGDPTLGELTWLFLRVPDGRVFAIEQVPD